MSSAEKADSQNTRWWESYLVRYFLGFIVGTVCVVVVFGNFFPCDAPGVLGRSANLVTTNATCLTKQNETPKSTDAKLSLDPSNSKVIVVTMPIAPTKTDDEVTSTMAIAIALLGMAYCYIASTPITVIHAGRMYRTWVERQTRTFWLGWAGVLGSSILFDLNKVPNGWGLAIPLIVGALLILLVDPFYLSVAERKAGKDSSKEEVKHQTALELWETIDPSLLGKKPISENRKRQGRTVVGLLVNSVAWACVIYSISLCVKHSAPVPEKLPTAMVLLALPVVWICIAQYTTLFQIMTKPLEFTSWYLQITSARSSYEAQDVRESYTHLREHANSIFIVVIEVSLLFLIMTLGHLRAPAQSSLPTVPNDYLLTIAALMAVWLVPTIFMWSRANWLEQEFADSPRDFAKPKSEK